MGTLTRAPLAVFFYTFFLAATANARETPKALDVQPLPADRIADGVFVHVGKPLSLEVPGHDDIANLSFVVGARCVAVIDTGGSVRIGRALRETVRRRTKTPICYVINTHDHVDHVLGNAAFAPDKPSFVGHAHLAAALARDRPYFVEHYAGDLDAPATAAQIIGPDKAVDATLELDLGGRSLTLRAWPKAHTDSDLTVEDDRTGTFWTGDLVVSGRLPSLDGSLTGWLAALDRLALMPIAKVVPGHGKITGQILSALEPEQHYLTAVRDGVRKALVNGEPIEQAMREVAIDERPHWPLWDGEHEHNVSIAYRELEWE